MSPTDLPRTDREQELQLGKLALGLLILGMMCGGLWRFAMLPICAITCGDSFEAHWLACKCQP